MYNVVIIFAVPQSDSVSYMKFFFVFFKAAPAARGGSQPGGLIRGTAAGLRHSLSNARSELHL